MSLDHAKRMVLVAAVADNGVIGLGGDIPWQISEDLKHFRAVTRDNTVLMGRRTYESIGHPLPYRSNIVLTRDPDWSAEGVFVAHDVDEAVALAAGFDGDLMVIGGATIYALTIDRADAQILTEVHLSPEGDTHYPEFDRSGWTESKREEHDGFAFVWLERGWSVAEMVDGARVVVMGVSGSGKTTVAESLAAALDAEFIEGDDLHPEANRAKMRSGTPLDDDDRWPWLDEVGRRLAEPDGAVVVTCSALKRSYRDRIRDIVPDAWFLHLDGDPDLLIARQSSRKAHFMPTSLMESQLETLEPLGPDEAGLRLDVADDVETLVRQVVAVLRKR